MYGAGACIWQGDQVRKVTDLLDVPLRTKATTQVPHRMRGSIGNRAYSLSIVVPDRDTLGDLTLSVLWRDACRWGWTQRSKG